MIFWRASSVLALLSVFGHQSSAATISPTSTSTVTSASSVPTPLVVPPSQSWDGNDGPWSSFFLRIGTPAQSMKVLISTASFQSWVVLPEGCGTSDPASCPNDRGNIYHTNTSSSWTKTNITQESIFSLPIESNLGYTGNGLYGFDNISLSYLGSGLPTLSNQLLAGIATKDFFTGLFGLNPATTNLSSFNNPIPSYMSNLKTQKFIPSLSYGYTAGAPYRYTGVFGSLTLGGYDKSLLVHNNLTFDFDPENSNDLTVSVASIKYTTPSLTTPKTLSSTPFPAYVDSTIPYLYLPLAVCQQFESAFGIKYDNTTDLYLVNDTLHTQLVKSGANVTFTLTNATGASTVDIVLPYAAFDLTAKYPLVKNTTRYFPLRRAVNDTQIVLGRAFLQEAYLIADYERSLFSLSQRFWSPAPTQQIITIVPPAIIINQTTAPSPSSSSIPIAAIVAGSVGGAVLITVLSGCILLIRIRNKKLASILASSSPHSKDRLLGRGLEEQGEIHPSSLASNPNPGRLPDPPVYTYKPELDAIAAAVKPPQPVLLRGNTELDSTPIRNKGMSPKYSLFPAVGRVIAELPGRKSVLPPPQVHEIGGEGGGIGLGVGVGGSGGVGGGGRGGERRTVVCELPATPVRWSFVRVPRRRGTEESVGTLPRGSVRRGTQDSVDTITTKGSERVAGREGGGRGNAGRGNGETRNGRDVRRAREREGERLRDREAQRERQRERTRREAVVGWRDLSTTGQTQNLGNMI